MAITLQDDVCDWLLVCKAPPVDVPVGVVGTDDDEIEFTRIDEGEPGLVGIDGGEPELVEIDGGVIRSVELPGGIIVGDHVILSG